ncbi:MAG: MarR family transcriptional regulator [Bacteroidales bacterium]|nr:MarR family transcriptional regulator [Bacteroidales bacterium]
MAYEQLKLDNQVCFRLYAVARLIIQGYQPFLSKLGITYTQYLVLMLLWEHDEMPVNDIAKRLLLETNTMTPLIKRMEADGIVVRKKDEKDARKSIVCLTPKGRSIEAEAANVPLCLSRELREAGLTEKTVMDIVPSLDEIIDKMCKREKQK